MNAKTMFSVSKVSGACLALSVTAWLIAAQLVTPTAIEPWRPAWLVVCGIEIIGAVLPLALIHAGLAAWADEAIERLERLRQVRNK